MIDAATISKHATPPPDSPYDTVPVHITFVDWIPGLCSTRELTSPHLELTIQWATS